MTADTLTPAALPPRFFELVDALARGRWSYRVLHETDRCGTPYVEVEAVRGTHRELAVWHSRGSGRYRIQTTNYDNRSVSFATLLDLAGRPDQ